MDPRSRGSMWRPSRIVVEDSKNWLFVIENAFTNEISEYGMEEIRPFKLINI